jgi:KaiC/GvpD/RAD55 family RecA-like ATPase
MRENDAGTEGRCDFCQSRFPVPPIEDEHGGETYAFCTESCRQAMAAADRVFTEYRGHRWMYPGVAALDAKLPQGILRNSMVLLSAQPGTRESELHAELVWRALNRGEPAVVVSFQEPPVSLVERFLSLEWNVLPFLDSGDLHVIDCFTYRVGDRERMFDRMNDWNAHLHRVAEPQVTAVHDPTNVNELESRLDDCTTAMGMVDRGLVLVDSLTEFGSLVQPVRAYDFVKDVRADVCKGRFVPVFAGAAYTGDTDQFPHDLEYLFDGIVDMEQNPELIEDALIKRMRVRKMSGVLTYPEWTAYEFTSDRGLVMFDPEVEVERTEASEAAEADSDEQGKTPGEDAS